ncbi:PAAR-like protein [Lacrimispora aerotolerans]|uniref:PAAR-like protein n=1 Tax=Lacrimispora aerotolerans TaxID=36832 RepID=UPI00068FFB9F|nr:PAAR-like protein [Lacrimispora aerotolerans]
MAELNDTFVVHGACSACSMGMRPSAVVLPETHGVFLRGQAQMTIKDCEGDTNVICFGGCYSMENPSTKEEAEKVQKAVDEACPETFTDKVMNFFTGGKKKKKEEPKDSETPQVVGVCTPRIIAQEWDHGQEGVETETERPLMGGAKLYCMYGGEIQIMEAGQPEAGSGESEKKQDKSENNNMADQLMATAVGMGLGIAKLGKAGLSLALENMDALVRGQIHQLLNPGENLRGGLQMALSLVPANAVNSKSKLFENRDLKEMDQIVNKYENIIYNKYKNEFDEYYKIRKDEKENPDKYMNEALRAESELKKRNIFKNADVMEYLKDMGNDVNSSSAITGHKNDLVQFVNMVNTNNPLDLKSRSFKNEKTGETYNYSIWSAPWPKEDGTAFEKDYAGNWLYGYVGDEYFTTPVDDGVLKYGAGAAQLFSDLRTAGKNGGAKGYKEAAAKYFQSLISGQYGDNSSEEGPSDADMIQEGINAHKHSN